ncbi:DNA polymerase theta-like isoform X2 [Oncorhynchus nerka]|uniref:DNA polymerase theta-like isoform X2 n=1 Tax=Oncorhynchus nerka TaxID=8023 RepID=UPI0031B806BA
MCFTLWGPNIDLETVDDTLRQQAKQICYGIIYGMGAKSLGEQMGIEEDDAGAYIESFKDRYTGVHRFLKETVRSCVKKGFVQTLLGGGDTYLTSTATATPGNRRSARLLTRQSRGQLLTSLSWLRSTSSNVLETPTLLLPSHTNTQVAQIVKREMESAVKLYVKLKAKVKVGPSWGNLQDLDI